MSKQLLEFLFIVDAFEQIPVFWIPFLYIAFYIVLYEYDNGMNRNYKYNVKIKQNDVKRNDFNKSIITNGIN